MRVCLASTSPARLSLLRAAGIEPLCIAPDVDEEAVIARLELEAGAALPAPQHVLVLAQHKANDVAARLAASDPAFDGVVIGGDSMFALGDEILGKPYTSEVATARWRSMRGRAGVLHSGHSVIRVQGGVVGERADAAAEASVHFADVDDDEIEAYVATGEPLLVAGAFTLDGLAGPFITRVEGDPSAVVGLSLVAVRQLCRALGVAWPSLWNRGSGLS